MVADAAERGARLRRANPQPRTQNALSAGRKNNCEGTSSQSQRYLAIARTHSTNAGAAREEVPRMTEWVTAKEIADTRISGSCRAEKCQARVAATTGRGVRDHADRCGWKKRG